MRMTSKQAKRAARARRKARAMRLQRWGRGVPKIRDITVAWGGRSVATPRIFNLGSKIP